MRTLLVAMLMTTVALATQAPLKAGDRVVPLSSKTSIVFLGKESGRIAIVESEKDPFFSSLSKIDAELRLAEPLPDATPEFRERMLKKLFQDAVSEWSEDEIQMLTLHCQRVFEAAQRIAPLFIPEQWKFIKTEGSEEAGAAYTRHDAIILPASKLQSALTMDASPNEQYQMSKLVAHETSHVMSRLHPDLRDRLYLRLGFRHVGPIDLGPYLNQRRITNPDGVLLEHVIDVRHPKVAGPFSALMVTYSKADHFAPETGRRLFDYLRYDLFLVENVDGQLRIRSGPDGVPPRYSPKEVTGFYDRIGHNTGYIIHPDEILADNLAILLTQHLPGVPAVANIDQQLLRDLAAILRSE